MQNWFDYSNSEMDDSLYGNSELAVIPAQAGQQLYR
jgi:hypothetical protein